MKRTFLLLTSFLLCLNLRAAGVDAADGGKVPERGNMVGGIGADGKYHFLLVANDGSLSVSGGGGGDASAANQTTGNASLASIDGKIPASPATAGNQTSANTKLDSIITNTTLPTLTRFRDTAVTNTAVAVKASAGSLYGWNIINPNTSAVYIKLYNIAAASVTVGTSTVAMTIAIPPSGAFFVAADTVPEQTFATAIALAAVTGLADNSTTAPSTAVHVSVLYQ